jgi:methionine synthase / methylenetetrahydrofolate reductase(NADPH)
MDGSQLRALLDEGPLLSDGGLGTTLIERGVIGPGEPFENANLERPDVVAEVHHAFVRAGARMVETNTFGANRFALAKHSLDDRLEEINRRGVEIAKHAGALVAGSVGPLRVRLAPYGRVRKAEAKDAYAQQIAVLADAGADLILIETQSDLIEIEQALAAAREACGLAVVVTATFTRDDRTLLGSTPQQVAAKLVELGADAIGVNCSEGPAQVLRVLHAMRSAAGDVPLVAQPNAGGPARVGERIVYPATAEYVADYARAFVAAGARIVGGCCGTSPEHIRSMAQALSGDRQLHFDLLPESDADTIDDHAVQHSALGAKLADGRFVITIEMDPPRGFSAARMIAGAETLRDAGADAINVADSPMARMRMSPWAPARLIQEQVGIETILHFPTRGRNVLRVQGDLLGVHALGIRNLFVVMGDPARIGDYPAATDNVDVVPTGLIKLVTGSFNEGHDQAGASIGEPTSFVVGCAVNLNPSDPERELKLLRRKITAGADFALSQAVYSPDALRVFRKAYEERYGPLDLPIVVGVLPLVTARHAEFLHNEVPGMSIPDEIRERLHGAGTKEAEEQAGLDVATDLARELRSDAAGLYIIVPFGRFDLGAEIVEAVAKA